MKVNTIILDPIMSLITLKKLCPDHENSKLVLDVVIANAAKAPYNRIKKQGEEAQKAAQHKINKLQQKWHIGRKQFGNTNVC